MLDLYTYLIFSSTNSLSLFATNFRVHFVYFLLVQTNFPMFATLLKNENHLQLCRHLVDNFHFIFFHRRFHPLRTTNVKMWKIGWGGVRERYCCKLKLFDAQGLYRHLASGRWRRLSQDGGTIHA